LQNEIFLQFQCKVYYFAIAFICKAPPCFAKKIQSQALIREKLRKALLYKKAQYYRDILAETTSSQKVWATSVSTGD